MGLPLLLSLLFASCESDEPGTQSASNPPLRELSFSLFERLEEFGPPEGLPRRSTRWLSLAQDPDRNVAHPGLRLCAPVNGSLPGPMVHIPPGSWFTAGVGLDVLDALAPDEGSGSAPLQIDRIRQEFRVIWQGEGPAIELGSIEVERDDRAGSRVLREWRLDLQPIADQEGRLLLASRRLEGPEDLRVLPTWWSPRLRTRARTVPEVFSPRPGRITACDLLDPDLDPRVVGRDGSSLAPGSPQLPRLVVSRPAKQGDAQQAEADEREVAPGQVRRLPLVGVEAHFETGASPSIPRGGARPAFTFVGDAELAFAALPPAASGTRLEFALGFEEEAGVAAPGAACLEVWWGEQLLSRFEHRAAVDPEQAGWGPTLGVSLPEFEGDPEVLSLRVRLESREARTVDLAGPQGRASIVIERPVLGLARPRLVRAPLDLGGPATAQRPSILVVSIETLRADAFGSSDPMQTRTPLMDRWAPRARVFDRAYAPASWTLPSLASLLTGLEPHQHGTVDERSELLPDWTRTLAEDARDCGHATAGFVSNELLRPGTGFDAGFDTYVCAPTANAMQLCSAFEDWLGRHQEQRFFALLHLFDPHDPYNAPGDLRQADVDPAQRDLPYSLSVAKVRTAMREQLDASVQPAELEYLQGRYRGEVRFLDRQLDALLKGLDRRGLLETTRVILVADHGEEFGEHEWQGHGSQLFEESVRVPLWVLGPGVEAGRVATGVSTRGVADRVRQDLGLPSSPGTGGELGLRGELVPRTLRLATDKGIDLTSDPRHVSLRSHPHRVDPRPLRSWVDGTRKAVLRLSRRPRPEDFQGDEAPGLAPLVEWLAWYDLQEDPGEASPRTVAWPEAPSWLRDPFEAWLREEAAQQRGLSTERLSASTLQVLESLGYTDGGTGPSGDRPPATGPAGGSGGGSAEDPDEGSDGR